MFHIQTELINRSYPKMGIQMYSEIIENGGLLFFANYGDLEKFFASYLEFNKKGYTFLIPPNQCTPKNLQGMLQSSIQVICEFTSPDYTKERIIDFIASIYEKITQHIANLCEWGKECNCMQLERKDPITLLIYLRREEELRKMLSSIPFHKK